MHAGVRWVGRGVAWALAVVPLASAVDSFEGAHGGGGRDVIPPAPWTCTSLTPVPATASVRGPAPRDDATLLRYPFYPLGGNLGEDVFLGNTTDRDVSGGMLDPFCGARTYNGHTGIDTDYVTFSYQDAGIPVFAALNGTVIAVHDGEFDRNTTWAGQPANFVILDHGGGHESRYWHLRMNSVSVTNGQVVRAGRQIGYMGSSGISTGPHLHFETRVNGEVVEPFVGNCRPGESLWLQQVPLNDATAIREFTITTNSLASWAGPPTDTAHTGTLLSGSRTIYFWINLLNMTPGLTSSYRVLRPDSSEAASQGATGFSGTFRWGWWWWSRTVNLDQIGVWHLEFSLNGVVKVLAPFRVVASAGQIINRPPFPVTVALQATNVSPHAASVCRILNFSPIDEPDYEVARFRYVWKVNGSTQRDVTVAGRADVLEQGLAAPGQTITCAVTPTDGIASTTTVTVAAMVYRPFSDWATNYGPAYAELELDGDADGLQNGIEYLLGSDPSLPSAAGTFTVDPVTSLARLELPKGALLDPDHTLMALTTTNLMDAASWVPATSASNGLVWIAGQPGELERYLRLRATFGSGPSATVLLSDVLGL